MAKEHGSLVSLKDLLPLLPEKATEEELAEAISATPELSARFELRSGCVTERSDNVPDGQALISEVRNRRYARANLWWAGRFVLRLRSTSFSMVAASGSTSYRSASRSRDLDLFCVAPAGRLWTSLTRGLILARAFRAFCPKSPEICFSCVMDEKYALALFREEQGPLFARDALETIVLRGEPTYTKLLGEAEWISTLYPNAYSARAGGSASAPASGREPSGFSRAAEAFLFAIVGGYLRAKARMLNARLSKFGQLDSVFTVRYGRGHLIYESRRYSKLKQRYSSGISTARPGAEGS